MLKLPKGLKKKKKGKKSKRKGEEDLFTEEELEKYRREHQQTDNGAGAVKENEEWSKFKDLTSGVDTVLKKTQGDLDRIKSTSFFQRVKKEEIKEVKVEPKRPVVEVTEADFNYPVQATSDAEDKSEYGITDDESEDEQDDIFDTSYVDAVERGEVKLAYVPDSPEEQIDDDIFDTSHVDVLIKGSEAKSTKGKKGLDIGIAVEVLTGRIDNVTVTTKRPKRVIPGDLLLDNNKDIPPISAKTTYEPVEKSILDTDADLPITDPIDLSVSLHTSLIQQSANPDESFSVSFTDKKSDKESGEEEIDEFTLLAAESLEVNSSEKLKLEEKEIKVEPVLQESWSAFEADKNKSVFAECIVEDQIDVIDPYLDQSDPFDTSFADAVIPLAHLQKVQNQLNSLDDDDDFDPRAEEVKYHFNNRRKSSVRIHLTDPSGIRESITSDDIIVNNNKEESQLSRDLLGSSTTDLTQLGDSPLDPVDINNTEVDPFDTTIVEKVAAPGKVELKLLEQELIGTNTPSIYRVPSDPDFDPRAEEPKKEERRASRPENLVVSKSVVFNVDSAEGSDLDVKAKHSKPVTPYYTREVSITEDLNEDTESVETLTKTRSDEDLAPKTSFKTKRRHSEYPQPKQARINVRASDLLENVQGDIQTKVLTPTGPSTKPQIDQEITSDPFDTSFAGVAPSKIELKLLAKEFSCEESINELENDPDLLNPSDDIFQIKALTPEPTATARFPEENSDPFDTSFADNLNPGRTELKLLESEFLN